MCLPRCDGVLRYAGQNAPCVIEALRAGGGEELQPQQEQGSAGESKKQKRAPTEERSPNVGYQDKREVSERGRRRAGVDIV